MLSQCGGRGQMAPAALAPLAVDDPAVLVLFLGLDVDLPDDGVEVFRLGGMDDLFERQLGRMIVREPSKSRSTTSISTISF